MDLQHLLSEATEAPPCGPDLEYDAAFMALDTAVQGKPEQEVGGTIVPAVEPDWPQVAQQAAALLSRSKDLRIAMQLVRALTRTEHLAGFASGIAFVNELLQRYWADLHPRLDADDNNDPTLRLNALASLEAPRGAGAAETLLRDVREAAIVPPTAQAKVLLRDVLILDGRLPGAMGGQSAGAVDGALRAAIERDPAVADVPAQAIAGLQRLRAFVAEQVGSELAPDVSALIDMLKPVASRMARMTGRSEVAAEDAAAAAATAGLSGDIRGRDDVNRAIDAICAYLERAEPSNPAPLLLRRAQRLLNKSFVELIADLAPDGVGQVRMIAGLKDE